MTRIYDTFPFDGELDLLEHRLKETYDLVDVFVLVEAEETFRGDPKPLHFKQNQARFAWAADKLRHVALPRRPDATPWQREKLQRNAVVFGLRDASPDDLVLILDADEIASRPLLQQLRQSGLQGPHRLAMTRHYGRLDLLAPRSTCCPSGEDPFPFAMNRLRPSSWVDLRPDWSGRSGLVARFGDIAGDAEQVLPGRTPSQLRQAAQMPTLPDAGRHLTAIESSEALRAKLSHLPHEELAGARALAPEHLMRAKRMALHHLGWWYAEQPSGPLPDDLFRLHEQVLGGGRLPPLPSPVTRGLARTWFWLRPDPCVPDGLVRLIDRHFEWLWPLLAPALVVADLSRRLAAAWQARRPEVRYRMGQPTGHVH